MEKFLNLKTYTIEKLKREDLVVVYEDIPVTILDMPLSAMMQTLREMFEKIIAHTQNKNVFFNISIDGKATKEDIIDLYDYIENALTDVFADNIPHEQNIDKEKDYRLGTYGMPKVNMKNINYMKWINGQSSLSGIGFKVYKHGSHWSRRLIK